MGLIRFYYFLILLFLLGCASPQPNIEITDLQMKNAVFLIDLDALRRPECKGMARTVTPDLSSKVTQHFKTPTGHRFPLVKIRFILKCGDFETPSTMLLGARGYIGREMKDGNIENLWIDPK